MNGVVRQIVRQVAEYEACKEWGDKMSAENIPEYEVEHHRQRDAHYRRHDKPGRVVGVVVMYTMEHEADLLSQLALRGEMENEPVKCVFGQAPDQYADYEQPRDIVKAYTVDNGFIEHVGDDGKI